MPVVPASASAWQLPQFSVKTALPAAGSPAVPPPPVVAAPPVSAGTLPTTGLGRGVLLVASAARCDEDRKSENQSEDQSAAHGSQSSDGTRTVGSIHAGTISHTMQNEAYGRDRGLTGRIYLTRFLLGLLYVLFFAVMISLFKVNLAFAVVLLGALAFFQYFTSDKLALKASGAKVVTPEQAPELHEMVDRLSRAGRHSRSRGRSRSSRPLRRTRSRPAAAASIPPSP